MSEAKMMSAKCQCHFFRTGDYLFPLNSLITVNLLDTINIIFINNHIPEKDINQISSRWFLSQFGIKHIQKFSPIKESQKRKTLFKINFVDLLANLSSPSNLQIKIIIITVNDHSLCAIYQICNDTSLNNQKIYLLSVYYMPSTIQSSSHNCLI